MTNEEFEKRLSEVKKCLSPEFYELSIEAFQKTLVYGQVKIDMEKLLIIIK